MSEAAHVKFLEGLVALRRETLMTWHPRWHWRKQRRRENAEYTEQLFADVRDAQRELYDFKQKHKGALMDSNYQAVYDAARASFGVMAAEAMRPSVLFRPALSVDGNKWCALYGANLQDGVAGFGDSPDEAVRDFDARWRKTL